MLSDTVFSAMLAEAVASHHQHAVQGWLFSWFLKFAELTVNVWN